MSERLTVAAPIAGSLVELADVPDDVFAQEMLGPGIAVQPDSTGVVEVVAPVDGVLSALHPHAFVIQVPDGRAVLVHLGLDTVRLLGQTFTLDCGQGDTVRAGQVLVTWDVAAAVAHGKPALCPVVALQTERSALHAAGPAGTAVHQLDPLFTWDA
ncbi:PTS glucose transporter subunit IIA [Isoptericola sp. b441]|uniref:PTS glucose transporter subunit IIA n=1 Tax=Actinotalea lenta TaxID=3064654 RepID=A0ABT9D8L5_9CELL|nr:MULTISPECIES: PTS glucose transporter subunit IIA [unclassified Isoptericola]MDO8107240.1 PTS glucose transporter subunit IIA [Isoptericola sp. b441]MDO8121097.1 PTS glucose transporter subunit IIA [Isoptericola sp. b490]